MVAFDKPALRRRDLLATDDGGLVAAYDPALHTAWAYRAAGAAVEPSGESDGRFVVDGEPGRAGDLPLERVYAFDAMWHAWSGFYPETAYAR